MTDVDEAKARVLHFLAERAKLSGLDQEEIAGVHGGASLMDDPEEPHAAALLRSDLVTLVESLTAAQLANHDVLAMTSPPPLKGDDMELHSVLTDGWNTAYWHACDLIRKRVR
jgi:hypothetical protein